MPFKLNKTKSKERDALVAALEIAASALNSAVESANEKIGEINAALDKAVSDYSDVLSNVREWRDDLTESAQDEYNEKSDKWQEGEAAGSASAWIEAWNEIDFDDLDAITIDEIEVADLEHRDRLEAAPDDMNS